MTDKNSRLAVGALTGLVGLIAMIRLVSGAFTGSLSAFAWFFILLAMLPWIGYVSWRARHGHLSTRARWVVLGLGLAGLLVVWLFTVGAVVALALSLAASVVIWTRDLPARRSGSEDQFVRVEELVNDEGE